MKIDIVERFNNVKYPQLQPEPPARTRLKREIQEGLNEANNKVNKIAYNQQYDIALWVENKKVWIDVLNLPKGVDIWV